MSEDTNRGPLLAAGLAGLILVLFVFAYALPRARANAELSAQIEAVQRSQMDIAALVPQALEFKSTLPDPEPDVSGWLSTNALGGLERRLNHNNSASNGRAAELSLRNLKPEEIVSLMNRLSSVNLSIRRLRLGDLGGRGSWELELFVEVPEGGK